MTTRTTPMALAVLFAGVAAGLALADEKSTHRASGPPGDKALGEYLSGECVTCHQVSGAYKGIPPIVGWPEESFVEIMNAYKTRERENAVMQNIAVKFSDDEIAALAAYFASVKPTQ